MIICSPNRQHLYRPCNEHFESLGIASIDIINLPFSRWSFFPRRVFRSNQSSINWLYCPLGEKVYIYRKVEKATKKERKLLIDEGIWEEKIGKERSSRDPIDLLRCHDHDYPFDSVIIYPTWLKTYDIHQINQVWSQALRKISESDELVFIGYSMPSSDTEIRYLLKKALKTKRMKTPTKEDIRKMREGTFSSEDLNFSIKVVNPIGENDFKRKYKTFFKSDVEFIEEYFEDWTT